MSRIRLSNPTSRAYVGFDFDQTLSDFHFHNTMSHDSPAQKALYDGMIEAVNSCGGNENRLRASIQKLLVTASDMDGLKGKITASPDSIQGFRHSEATVKYFRECIEQGDFPLIISLGGFPFHLPLMLLAMGLTADEVSKAVIVTGNVRENIACLQGVNPMDITEDQLGVKLYAKKPPPPHEILAKIQSNEALSPEDMETLNTLASQFTQALAAELGQRQDRNGLLGATIYSSQSHGVPEIKSTVESKSTLDELNTTDTGKAGGWKSPHVRILKEHGIIGRHDHVVIVDDDVARAPVYKERKQAFPRDLAVTPAQKGGGSAPATDLQIAITAAQAEQISWVNQIDHERVSRREAITRAKCDTKQGRLTTADDMVADRASKHLSEHRQRPRTQDDSGIRL